MKKKALISGVFGQDGSYLAEILMEKGYEVHGIEKMPLTEHSQKIATLLKSKGVKFHIHNCNLNDFLDVERLFTKLQPDECYHLAAVHYSSSMIKIERDSSARELFESNVMMASNIIHSIMLCSKHTRLVVAGSCLMFDNTKTSLQDENMPYDSNSVYGLSKITASNLVKLYREKYGLHLSTAILFNHESPRRPYSFVTQKIAQNVARIKKGEITDFTLGNLESRKDWGYARDYVYGMWLMAQKDVPKDYVLSSGELHSILEFLEVSFRVLDINDWRKHVLLDDKLIATTGAILKGDPRVACKELNWSRSLSFDGLVSLMTRSALSNSID